MNFSKPEYPLISVITVSFNAADFISQTIESVLSQTYPRIEYIIIDGGSTDGTAEIIRKNESRLAYWHSRPDNGIANAFNLGWNKSQGDWIIFLNADDLFCNDKVLENLVPYLIKYKDADVVYGQLQIITNDAIPQPIPFSKILGRRWRWEEFRLNNTIPHQSAFTNKKLFVRMQGFDENTNFSVDYEFYLRAGKSLKAQFVPMMISRMRKGGISNRSMVRTLIEFRLAQEKTKALPQYLTWINFFWQIGRCYLGKAAHLILDPLAYKIKWPGRNTGTSIGMK